MHATGRMSDLSKVAVSEIGRSCGEASLPKLPTEAAPESTNMHGAKPEPRVSVSLANGTCKAPE